MRIWKDRTWQLVLVIVGALILSFCNTGLKRTAKNDNGTSNGGGGTGIALANGFKPSDITGVMICDGYSDGEFTSCYRTVGTTYSGPIHLRFLAYFLQDGDMYEGQFMDGKFHRLFDIQLKPQ